MASEVNAVVQVQELIISAVTDCVPMHVAQTVAAEALRHPRMLADQLGRGVFQTYHLAADSSSGTVDHNVLITGGHYLPLASSSGRTGYFAAEARQFDVEGHPGDWQPETLIYDNVGRLIEVRLPYPALRFEQVLLVARDQVWEGNSGRSRIVVTGVNRADQRVSFDYVGLAKPSSSHISALRLLELYYLVR